MSGEHAHTKRVYLVRHGETDLNKNKVYQNPETPLSEHGQKQAEFLARRLKTVPADCIISSTFLRARETANAIRAETGHDILFSDLFRELQRPSIVIGRSKSDPDVRKVADELVAHETDPTYRHSDEETLFDLAVRARKAMQFLEERPENNLIVVSHNTIIRMILMVMACADIGEAVTTYRILRYFMEGANTGVTIVELDEESGHTHWRLRTWNDRAHLAK